MANELTEAQETAALLIAQGQHTYTQVAEQIGVRRETIRNWRLTPEFRERIKLHVEELTAEIRSFGIGQMHNRVKALQDRHDRCERIMLERATDPRMENVPGGSTGLLVHNVKAVGTGEKVDLYAVDTALLAELRAIEQQAAKELGEWIDRAESEVNGKLAVDVGMSISEVMGLEQMLEAYKAAKESKSLPQ